MHGSLPEPKVHVSKLASILIIVDLEGQAAKKEKKKKKQAKGTVCYGWERNSWAKKAEWKKTRMTQFQVARFPQSL